MITNYFRFTARTIGASPMRIEVVAFFNDHDLASVRDAFELCERAKIEAPPCGAWHGCTFKPVMVSGPWTGLDVVGECRIADFAEVRTIAPVSRPVTLEAVNALRRKWG